VTGPLRTVLLRKGLVGSSQVKLELVKSDSRFFRNQHFLDPNFFGIKTVLDLKSFWTQNALENGV